MPLQGTFLPLSGRFKGILQEAPHIQYFLAQLQNEGCKPSYVHGHYKDLRTFFNWQISEGYINKSPIRNLKAPKIPKIQRSLVSEVQRDRLLAMCPQNAFLGVRNAALIWLFWSTGMRRKEVATLNKADLVWEGKGRIKVWGKGAKERWVPFTKPTQKAMVRYLHHRRDLDHPELWLTEERRPAKDSALVTAMRRLIDRAKLRDEIGKGELHHVFRRSWAIRNLKKGRSLKEIQIIGGWESMRAMEIYLWAMTSDDALEKDWE